ncbi:hypothetical protein [Pelagimonas varians]|uniref:Uncharacterized protein n=1 Tax=Pelagimonas varians TaxID=696760 RepID=A0A238L8P6_9RHOB|nr:hypothetical protein [Pelagimonas varians]PYG24691.1 hypothetical protein C8N36_1482 [Pelagimonas varians]SMX50752.1 hypothetical protein PEV8663_04790 [Pelagimonas varians]
MFGVAAQLDQQLGIAPFGDQIDIFDKHRKQATHQKAGDGLAVMALGFEALAEFGKVLGNFAGRRL